MKDLVTINLFLIFCLPQNGGFPTTVADEINSFFKNVTKNLRINENIYTADSNDDITDPVN